MHKNLNGFLVNTLGLAKRSLMSTAISSDAVMPLFAALCLGFASLIASGTDLAAATFGKAYNKRIATVPIGWPVFDLFAFSDDSTVSMYTRKDPRDYQLGVSTKLRFTDTGGVESYVSYDPAKDIHSAVYWRRGFVDSWDRFVLFYDLNTGAASSSQLGMAVFSKTGTFLFDKVFANVPSYGTQSMAIEQLGNAYLVSYVGQFIETVQRHQLGTNEFRNAAVDKDGNLISESTLSPVADKFIYDAYSMSDDVIGGSEPTFGAPTVKIAYAWSHQTKTGYGPAFRFAGSDPSLSTAPVYLKSRPCNSDNQASVRTVLASAVVPSGIAIFCLTVGAAKDITALSFTQSGAPLHPPVVVGSVADAGYLPLGIVRLTDTQLMIITTQSGIDHPAGKEIDYRLLDTSTMTVTESGTIARPTSPFVESVDWASGAKVGSPGTELEFAL